MEDVRKLLVEIARCPIATEIRAGSLASSLCCQKIVGLQKNNTSFQLPEPWSGRIDQARILFVSSNPSIDPAEHYPDPSWESDSIIHFFQHRFDRNGCVKQLKALRRDGTCTRVVNYWTHARARTSEILEKERKKIVPGDDFALTEVVHCKSPMGAGVKEAREFCSGRYLERVLSVSAARVLIVYGDHAKKQSVAVSVP